MTYSIFLLISLAMMFAIGFTVYTPNKHFTGMRNGVQFTNGKGEATKEQAKNLVDIWGYSCPELEGKKEKKAPDKILKTFGDEEIEMTEENGVAVPIKTTTNAGLKAFMDDQKIDFESDDNKPDLNKKISAWAKQKSSAETSSKEEDKESDEGQSD